MTPDNIKTRYTDIYEPNRDFPSAVTHKDGYLLVDPNQIYEGSAGPFIHLSNFGRSLSVLAEPLPVGFDTVGVKVEADKNPLVARAVDNLTLLANLYLDKFGLNWWDNIDLAKFYVANFTAAFSGVFDRTCQELSVDSQTTVLFAPLRGGEIVHIIARALGHRMIMPALRASRVVLKDNLGKPGDYMVGVSFKKEDISELGRAFECPRAIFADDCLAAGGSQVAVYEGWKNGLTENGLQPEKMAVVAGVGVLRTAGKLAERIQRLSVANRTTAVNLAGAAYSMNEDYYLTLSPEQKATDNRFCSYNMRVGDMGRIMSLKANDRKEILVPIINNVATEKIPLGEVLHLTSLALNQPERINRLSSYLDGRYATREELEKKPRYIFS